MSQARHEYFLHSEENGVIAGRAWTNDNLDWGEPSEEAQWDVRCRSMEAALKQTGGTHVGISGCQVNVYLDGHLVDKDGNKLQEPRPQRAPRP